MGLLLEFCAGHVHVFSQGSSGGRGFYKVSPDISVSGDGMCLITGTSLNLAELTQPTITLDRKRFIFAYGSAWTDGGISGVLLLGDKPASSGALEGLKSWYKSNRVSVKKGPIQLSAGNEAIEFYLKGLLIEPPNPAFNIQPFTLTGHIDSDDA